MEDSSGSTQFQFHKVLNPVTPDNAIEPVSEISEWLAPHTHENTGNQQSCASEGIEPAICTLEFQIMTDHELLTTVSKAWGTISCATAGASKNLWKILFYVSFVISFLYDFLWLLPSRRSHCALLVIPVRGCLTLAGAHVNSSLFPVWHS